ncbi:phosphatase PAP2 family protein [Qipengyuania sp.]|uniref:phosphatase PAP2 family protein n=1 Tax=Qipengyuania sp. TaxID=2004515 RepID=UPI0035C8519E
MAFKQSDIVTPQEPPLPAEDVHLPERGFTINRRKAAAVALVCWLGWGIMVWLVLKNGTIGIDRAGLLWFRTGADLQARGGIWVVEAVRDITALGGVLLSTLVTVAAVVALMFLKLRREAVLFALTVILGWGLNTLMKTVIGRDRPNLVPHLSDAAGLSFPSGHSFASAMIYIGMALAFASLSQRHSVRYLLIASAMVLSAFIAWSRVLLGVHYPSDAIAGWLGGAAWAFTAAALLYKPARAAAETDTVAHLDPRTG